MFCTASPFSHYPSELSTELDQTINFGTMLCPMQLCVPDFGTLLLQASWFILQTYLACILRFTRRRKPNPSHRSYPLIAPQCYIHLRLRFLAPWDKQKSLDWSLINCFGLCHRWRGKTKRPFKTSFIEAAAGLFLDLIDIVEGKDAGCPFDSSLVQSNFSSLFPMKIGLISRLFNSPDPWVLIVCVGIWVLFCLCGYPSFLLMAHKTRSSKILDWVKRQSNWKKARKSQPSDFWLLEHFFLFK